MSVLGAVEKGRLAALKRMTELVRVGTETRTTDEASGDPIRGLTDIIYGGDDGAPGEIKYVGDALTESDTSGQEVAEQSPILKVPTGTPVLPRNKVVHVVSSQSDGSLVGRRYKIDGAPKAGLTTSNRYPLSELT